MSRQPFIWAGVKLIERLSLSLPHEQALRLGGLLGRTVGAISRSHASRARARASRILGIAPKEADTIVRGTYEHFGRAAVEFLRLPIMMDELEGLISIRGEENLIEAEAQGRGVIFLSAHIGNWELGAALLARRGHPIWAIGADQRDERITSMITARRSAAGVRPISKGAGLRGAIECLKEGGVLAVLLDQDARDAGVVVPFLGAPASTPIGPLKLAQRFGSPIVPVRAIRNQDGKTFTMTIEPPLEIIGEQASYIELAAEHCNRIISRWIMQNKDQWLWMYPRWATTLGDR